MFSPLVIVGSNSPEIFRLFFFCDSVLGCFENPSKAEDSIRLKFLILRVDANAIEEHFLLRTPKTKQKQRHKDPRGETPNGKGNLGENSQSAEAR